MTKTLAQQMLERILRGEEEAKGGILKAAVEEIKRLELEVEKYKNPQIW